MKTVGKILILAIVVLALLAAADWAAGTVYAIPFVLLILLLAVVMDRSTAA